MKRSALKRRTPLKRKTRLKPRSTRNSKRRRYKSYLESPAWKEMREKVLARDGRCRKCGSEERLQVHHIHYRSFMEEDGTELVALCPPCHFVADLERLFGRVPEFCLGLERV